MAAVALLKALIEGVAPRMVSLSSAILLAGFSFYLLRENYIFFSRHCLFFSAWLIVSVAVLTSGGVHEVAVFWFAVLICLVGLLGSYREVVVWGSVSLLTIIMLFLLEMRIINLFGLEITDATDGHKRFHIITQFIAVFAVIANYIFQFDRYETELVEQIDQVTEEVDRRSKAEAEVEAASKAKINFFANVSHEMRTPLNSIVGFSSRLLKKADVYEPRDLKAIEIIHKNGHSLVLLVNDLLELSELDSLASLSGENFHCAKILEAHAESLKSVANSFGIDLTLHIQEDLEIHFHISSFEKILMALVNFSIRQTFEGGVQVNLEKGEYEGAEVAALTVTDSSTGMTDEQMARLFELHYDLVLNSDRELSSSALSLVLARRLADLNSSTINAGCLASGGVQFAWYIPLAKK